MIFTLPGGVPRLACDECGCHWFDRMSDCCYECGAEVSAEAKEEYLRALAAFQAGKTAVPAPTAGNRSSKN